MATKKRKSNKFGITPSVIFLNLTVVLLIVIICFFTYNVIKGDTDNSSSVPPFTAVTDKPESTDVPESETSSVTSTVNPDVNSSTVETSDTSSDDNSITSDESSDNSSAGIDEPSSVFDKEYFNTSLFIGDSISTGLSLYGFLDSDNVFATQGLAPSTAISTEIDGKTLSDKIASFKPEKVFIMLGTNSVGYAESEYLVESMKDLIGQVTGMCKSDIYVLSIPPVTAAAEANSSNYLTLEAINEYNTLLKSAVAETNAKFLDFNALLQDSTGYFAEDYAEADGIHFMGTTYQVMLSFLEKQTSAQ